MDLRDDFEAWWGGVVGLLLCMIDYGFRVTVRWWKTKQQNKKTSLVGGRFPSSSIFPP